MSGNIGKLTFMHAAIKLWGQIINQHTKNSFIYFKKRLILGVIILVYTNLNGIWFSYKQNI